MSLIDAICRHTWALDEATLARLLAIADRAGRAEALTTDEVREAVEANAERRSVIVAARSEELDKTPEELAAVEYAVHGSVAVVPVEGVLANKASMVNGLSQPQGTTHAAVAEALQKADADPRVRSILLDFDSPGGTVAGTNELAEVVRGLNKPVVAYANGQMCSAAYWAGSQAKKVFASRMARVGSIGIYMILDDTSERLKSSGITRHIVRIGDKKGLNVSGTPVTPEAKAVIHDELVYVYNAFVSDVAAARKMPMERALAVADGRAYGGADAQSVGLVDGVKPYGEMLAWMEQEYGGGGNGSVSTRPAGQRDRAARATSAEHQKMADTQNTVRADGATADQPAESTTMSNNQESAAQTTSPAAAAATFEELHAAFAGKDDSLIVEAQKNKWSLARAWQAYGERMEARAKAAEQKAAETSRLPNATAIPPLPMTPANPVAATPPPADGEPKTFEQAVALVAQADKLDVTTKQGLAVAQYRAAKRYPGLRDAKLEEGDGIPTIGMAGPRRVKQSA